MVSATAPATMSHCKIASQAEAKIYNNLSQN